MFITCASLLVLSSCTGGAPEGVRGGHDGAGQPSPLRTPGVTSPLATESLQRRVLTELRVFVRWLRRHGVQGYVGEVGWPDDERGDAARWNALAERWFELADRAGLWVTSWATGEWWGTDYPLAAYEDVSGDGSLDNPNTQAAVLERHLGSPRILRGISVAGGEFGAPVIESPATFSNRNPGTYDVDYHFDSQASFHYLAGRGFRVVRIPFRWERLQPALGGPLDRVGLRRLRSAVARAGVAGLRVVLDMHNYGAYYEERGPRGVRRPLGSPWCTVSDFAGAWRRISEAFRGNPAVLGYGLMNDPVDLASSGSSPSAVWRRASQAALAAIRASGDRKVVFISGYFWSSLREWPARNPRPWIRDPLGRFRYEAHHYWDHDASGTYPRTYEGEVALARMGSGS
jgi:Cellulase (glycosyl hydrolase family 5)